jgi:hypothetical protein
MYTALAASASIAQNQADGEEMSANEYGWTGGLSSGQGSCLNSLWERESGWNNLIENPGSGPGTGAFGIAQALGHGGVGATDPVVYLSDGTVGHNVYVNQYPDEAANAGNADAQIAWGLNYIAQTYGSPCGAWAHEKADNWY